MINRIDGLTKLKHSISKEKKIVKELNNLFNSLQHTRNPEENKIIESQINSLKTSLKKTNMEGLRALEGINISRPLITKSQPKIEKKSITSLKPKTKKLPSLESMQKKNPKISSLDKETLKRIKKKKKKVAKKKVRKPNPYVKIANRCCYKFSTKLLKKSFFRTLERDLVKSKMQFTPSSYISVILFTTFLSIIAGALIFLFFLFFNIGSTLPIVTKAIESAGERVAKVFWILFAVPIATFLIMYFYPSLEKKTAAIKINQELPFATIHMAAISGSMIEPNKIFSIIISTGEYPNLEKEFIKIINEINIYGNDLSTALRNVAFNTPS